MHDPLSALFKQVWQGLASAATGGEPSDWRHLNFATIDQSGAPQTRLVVLRDVDVTVFGLRLHTDVRSAKWEQVGFQPTVSLLGYDAQSRQQIRLTGHARQFGPGSTVQKAAWDALSPWTRTTYCGGPPGHAVAEPMSRPREETAPALAETAHGRRRFGVIDVSVSALDWYQHPRGNIRRALFEMSREGGLQSAQWIEP